MNAQYPLSFFAKQTLAAFIFILSSSMVTSSTAVFAGSNPWARAIGEAVELARPTEDLRNRTSRLYPGSPVAQLACRLDETACSLLEMIKNGVPVHVLQSQLQNFDHLQQHLCTLIAADCYISRDNSVRRYMETIHERFDRLVRDLSKCNVPATCDVRSHYPTPYLNPVQPWNPQPSVPYHGWQLPRSEVPPSIPGVQPGLTPQPFDSSSPRFWQGSLPPNYPRSTYDFEPRVSTQRPTSSPWNESYVSAPQRSAANEIIGLILRELSR